MVDIFKSFGIKKKSNSLFGNKSTNVFNKVKSNNKTTNILSGFNKNTTRNQFMNSKPTMKMQFKDSDNDGYINRIDCRPFDKNRQGGPVYLSKGDKFKDEDGVKFRVVDKGPIKKMMKKYSNADVSHAAKREAASGDDIIVVKDDEGIYIEPAEDWSGISLIN